MNLIFAQNPDAKKIGLLYDVGQDSSQPPSSTQRRTSTTKVLNM